MRQASAPLATVWPNRHRRGKRFDHCSVDSGTLVNASRLTTPGCRHSHDPLASPNGLQPVANGLEHPGRSDAAVEHQRHRQP